jgi:hypothetical protein
MNYTAPAETRNFLTRSLTGRAGCDFRESLGVRKSPPVINETFSSFRSLLLGGRSFDFQRRYGDNFLFPVRNSEGAESQTIKTLFPSQ